MTRRPALLITALAPAQPAADAGKLTASMEGQTAPDATPIRCRAMDTIGTRFVQKECKSAKAWEEFGKLMADNAREQTGKLQRAGSGAATSAGQ